MVQSDVDGIAGFGERIRPAACEEPSTGTGVWEMGLGQRTVGVLPMSVSASQTNSCANFPNLIGKRILVVDDEAVVSVDYRYQLLDAGATPAGFVPSNEAAMSFLETHPVDAVIVDHCLQDGTSEPVVAWLIAHHVPFVMVSGWVEKLKGSTTAMAILEKPASPADLRQALSEIVH